MTFVVHFANKLRVGPSWKKPTRIFRWLHSTIMEDRQTKNGLVGFTTCQDITRIRTLGTGSCNLERNGWWIFLVFSDHQLQLVSSMEPNGEHLPDVLLVLEHQPVYTLGTGANEEFIKFDLKHPPCEVYRIERGGEITFHGPGQLIFYPILNLRYHKKDLRWYLRRLEQVVIEALKIYGLEAHRVEGLTGVWLDNKKIAAIGIAASKWITMHGVALNVINDLEPFRKIVPCGIRDREVGRLVDYVPGIDMQQLRIHLAECFADMFQLSLIPFEE